MDDRQIVYTEDMTVRYEETIDQLHIKNHYHNTYELIFITEGRAGIKINSKNYEAGPGSLIFLNHLESHEVEALQSPYKRYYLLIKPQFFQTVAEDRRLGSIFKNRPDSFRHVLSLKDDERGAIASLFMQIKQELDSDLEFKTDGAASLVKLLLIRLYRTHPQSFPSTDATRSTNVVHQIQKYIDENYLEPITLKTVSEVFFIDMYYLSRLFKKICGFSFKEYLILQRLSAAKELLVNGDKSITQVCSDSGFCNVNHFIRIFKQNEGTSPCQYRKKYRKDR